MALSGYCNCQAIQVVISNADKYTANTLFCHCNNCRRSSGGLGTIFMPVADEDVKIDGTPVFFLDKDTTTGEPMKRWFCEKCGRYSPWDENPAASYTHYYSAIMSTSPAAAGNKFMKMGLFDKIPRVTTEQFTKRRQEWDKPFEGAAQVLGMTE